MILNRQQRLEKLIKEVIVPVHFELLNESHNHSVPDQSETHFKLLCVSPIFEGVSRIERQRKIYALADHELKNGLHALSLQLFTPSEWEKYAANLDLSSPKCHGGNGK